MFDHDGVAGVVRWPLVRISVGGKTRVVLLSKEFLPLSIHWVGKSVVCSRENCALCEWLPARALFYVACSVGGRASMLELGAMSSSHLEQHCKLLHRGMRPGLVVELTRRSAKSPVYAEVVEEMTSVAEVTLVELVGRVMALYHLPGPNPGECLEAFEKRVRMLASKRSEIAAASLKERRKVGV